jgi:AcrR family transcriptional regulator
MLANANPNGEPLPRQRLTSAERRAAIVKVAIELFAKHGFRGTTTRELASAVGVSEPVLYQHFATKRDLYTAIVDHMVAEASRSFDRVRSTLAGATDDRSFLQWYGERLLDFYLDQTDYMRLLLFSALEGHDLAEIWHERCTVDFLRMLESHIGLRVEEGAFREMSPAMAMRAFIGMVAHYGQVSAIYKCPAPELSRQEAVSQFVEVFLNGVSRKSVVGEV